MPVAGFKSWRSYLEFSHRVRSQNRYFRDPASAEFCQTVLATAAERKRRLKEGASLCRAQKGEYEGPTKEGDIDNADQPFPLLPERMTPLQNRAMEGRANPKGIPYLYTATNTETAIAESRASIGETVSIAVFRTVRDLLLADFSISSAGPQHFYFEEPDSEKRLAAVWHDIDHAFSRPVNRSDDSADYAPTQIISELFRHNGFDGICYGSSLASGKNVVLFDLKAAEIRGCCLYRVTKVKFDFEQAGNPYVVDGGKVTWNTIEVVGAVSPPT